MKRLFRRRPAIDLATLAVTARHEAAHAVAAHRLGFMLRVVSTVPGDHYDGRCDFRADDGGPAMVSVEAAAVALAAGFANPDDDPGGMAADYQHALRLALAVSARTTLAPSVVLDQAAALARRVVAEHRAAIDRLAAALAAEPTMLLGAGAWQIIDGEDTAHTEG